MLGWGRWEDFVCGGIPPHFLAISEYFPREGWDTGFGACVDEVARGMKNSRLGWQFGG